MKHLRMHRRGWQYMLLGVALLVGVGIWGCSRVSESPTGPALSTDDSSARMQALLDPVMKIQDRHTPSLMADAEVIGTATTLDDAGHPAIMVLATSQRALDAVPKSLDGIPVQAILTDKFVAMKSSGTSHTAFQTPPIQLGTSGGWRKDLANGYCCGGTLGSLIAIGSQQRILSNYHVFESDIVSGGNGTTAQTGDFIIQPGLIDVNCSAAGSQNVATLVKTSSLPGSNVDCSSANVISGMVRTDGAILEVGVLHAGTGVAAFVNQAVKKSGRTTGLTRSTVNGLNATVSVQYENECAGGIAFTKTFTGQILVANRSSRFLNSGDSGSLMVQDVTTNPNAVGLLFAGSSSIAVANPIGQVLSFFGATMVGN